MDQYQQVQQEAQPLGDRHRTVLPRVESLPFRVKESINVLRGNIQLSGYNLKLLAVTSAVPDEGKSSISFHLAKSFASLGKKTLFIDCDIRKSVLNARYGIPEQVEGLAEFLCGKRRIPDVVYETDDSFLDIIFTGAQAPNPSELISSLRFRQLCTWAGQKYDYVILDTPPVNSVIDGALIAKQCDGCVLVIAAGKTDRAQVIRARRQLEYAGVRVLGAVMNKVEEHRNTYYGYNYYYSGPGRKAKETGQSGRYT